MFDRIIGVFKLDVNTFEEIEHDQTATGQAATIVLIVAVLAGIGSGLGSNITGGTFIGNFFSSVISVFAGWLLWSVVSYFVGTSLFGGQADLGEMMRVIGFAYSPQILSIIPCIGTIIGFIWSLIAGFIAIRQGLDLDNVKALATVVIGFIVYVILFAVLGAILGGANAILGG